MSRFSKLKFSELEYEILGLILEVQSEKRSRLKGITATLNLILLAWSFTRIKSQLDVFFGLQILTQE